MRLLVAGGGTGGHLFPGLAVARELRAAGHEVMWLGARRGLEAERVPAEGFPLTLLAVSGAVGRSSAVQVGALARLPVALLRAASLILKERIDGVLAVGGYASLPGALAAAALGVPLVLQEQNAIPGVTTRSLAPWADAIACGFAAGLACFPSLPARLTGNPVRREFFEVPAPPGGGTLLVLGGSQGSAALNRTVPEALALLASDGLRPLVVHQAGPRWADAVAGEYRRLAVAAEVVPFLERPASALADASLVVARAGALTVCELAAARRAAVLIPFAAAAHGHQAANATALARTGAADVLEEAEATPGRLATVLRHRLADPAALAARGAAGAGLARERAAGEVAALVVACAGGAA